MKKGGKSVSSLKEECFNIFMDKEFQDKILPKLRQEFGIPEDGFFVRDDPEILQEPERTEAIRGWCTYEEWVVKTTRDGTQEKLHKRIKQICKKKYRLPANAELTLAEYVCIGPTQKHSLGFMSQHAMEIDFYPLDKDGWTDKKWKDAKAPFVKLYIASMSQKEVFESIKEQWKVIETLWEIQGWNKNKKKRTKTTKDPEVVYRATQLSKKKSGQIMKNNSIRKPKPFIIKDKLKREFPDKFIPSSESIDRKRYRKQKKKD